METGVTGPWRTGRLAGRGREGAGALAPLLPHLPPPFCAPRWPSRPRSQRAVGSRSASRGPEHGRMDCSHTPAVHVQQAGTFHRDPSLASSARPLSPQGPPGGAWTAAVQPGVLGWGHWGPGLAGRQREEASAPGEVLVLAWPLPGLRGQASDVPVPPPAVFPMQGVPGRRRDAFLLPGTSVQMARVVAPAQCRSHELHVAV